MKPAELKFAGRVLYGDSWQTQVALGLARFRPIPHKGRPLEPRLIRFWMAGDRPIPDWVAPALIELSSDRELSLRMLRPFLGGVIKRS